MPAHNPGLYAIGHSTMSAEELLERLQSFGVVTLADIRSVPRSRKNPQFNRETLLATLRKGGIRYVHVPELGGLRRPRPDSKNTAWRNLSFRGYADHMETEEFERGVQEILALAKEGPLAFMCAEALRWRCHRSLLADGLLARGIPVSHIVRPGRAEPHRLTSFARVRRSRIRYVEASETPQKSPSARPLRSVSRKLLRRTQQSSRRTENGT